VVERSRWMSTASSTAASASKDVRWYNSNLNKCLKMRYFPQAVQLYSEMKAAVRISINISDWGLSLCFAPSRLCFCFLLSSSLSNQNVEPTPVTYELIFSVYSELRDSESAAELMADLKAKVCILRLSYPYLVHSIPLPYLSLECRVSRRCCSSWRIRSRP
jgi:hypothetical protein